MNSNNYETERAKPFLRKEREWNPCSAETKFSVLQGKDGERNPSSFDKLGERERERERERESGSEPLNPNDLGFRESKFNFPKRKKSSSKLWLVIILGIIALAGGGTIAYFAWPKSTETTQEKVQQFQSQLAQIKTALNTLNRNITQTESSLQTKKTEQTQAPLDSRQTEINQLEQKLITYKNQKAKIEAIIPKLEQQISNLGKKESDSKSNQDQTKIIQQLEKEIKQISKELGIKAPEPRKPDKPNNPDSPTPPVPSPNPTPDLPNSSMQNLLDDLKIVEDYLVNCNNINEANKENLTKTADGKSKYEADKTKYQEGLKDIKELRDKFIPSSPAQSEVIKTRAEFRQKWSNIFTKPPSPNPQPTPEEEWEKNKSTLINNAISDIDKAIQSANDSLSWINEEKYKYPDWKKKLKNVSGETELNTLKEEILKDTAEFKLVSLRERLKLKDYFIFQLGEILSHWPDGKINVRSILSTLKTDLNQAIKDNSNSTWERKYIALLGFNINSKDDGKKFDEWSTNNSSLYIVIKKNHNSSQYSYERNYFFLKKGEPDYHEFNTRKEAIDWLRQNDSYFKTT